MKGIVNGRMRREKDNDYGAGLCQSAIERPILVNGRTPFLDCGKSKPRQESADKC